MQSRHLDRRRYFMEEAATTEKYFIPYLSRFVSTNGVRVLEVGCGEGGNLLPFARRACRVTGVDMSELRIRQAQAYFREEGAAAEFVCSDILNYDCHGRSFDIIIMHDVVEHVSDKAALLSKLSFMLAHRGVVFVAFPPWQMPFGGHQQIARSRFLSHIPFVHLLPHAVYEHMLKLFGEDNFTVDELMAIRKTRCTVEELGRIAAHTGYAVADMKLWMINPHYETKFGLRPLALPSPLRMLPYVRDFLTSSCFYLLCRKNAAGYAT